MNIKNNKGVILVISLLVVTVLLVLGSIFILKTVVEKNLSDRERRSTQAFYIADGGGDEGLYRIDQLVNANMLETVNRTNPQTVAKDAAACVTTKSGLPFLLKYVKVGGVAQFILNGSQLEYAGSSTALGAGAYQYKIIVTQKGDPIQITVDMWDLPFYYRLESTGAVSGVVRRIIKSGDFTVRVQRDNFAKYALFTDHQFLPSGTTVWFTNSTHFKGTIHTNDQFNFAKNPGPTFDGVVTQHLSKGRFYNNGSPVQLDADNNSPADVPTFNAGYTRSADEIVLESSVQKADLQLQAEGGTSPIGNGIFLPNQNGNLVGGIFVRGNSTINMSVDGSHNAVYTITQGASTRIITVDIPNNQTTIAIPGGGASTYTGRPDGMDDLGTIIYVDGEVSSLAGTVQKNTEVTVSSENDIIITDHLQYSDYNPASGTPGSVGYVPVNADDKENLLGIVSWGGDVRIGTTAPDNLNVHGVIMARNDIFSVDDYDDMGRGPRGIMTLLGGAITHFYGAFGLFNGETGALLSGYGRNYVYDSRTAMGKSPPYFPSLKTFIAFTNDIADKVVWQEGGF